MVQLHERNEPRFVDSIEPRVEQAGKFIKFAQIANQHRLDLAVQDHPYQRRHLDA